MGVISHASNQRNHPGGRTGDQDEVQITVERCVVLFKPMINWVTDWCLKAGIEKICVVVGSGADQVRAALPQQCVTVEQTERLGTGHAVMMAKEFIREHPRRRGGPKRRRAVCQRPGNWQRAGAPPPERRAGDRRHRQAA